MHSLYIAKAPLREDVKIKLITLLAQNGGSAGMVLGQAIDCYFENKPLELEQIKTLHKNKTAKLIDSFFTDGCSRRRT